MTTACGTRCSTAAGARAAARRAATTRPRRAQPHLCQQERDDLLLPWRVAEELGASRPHASPRAPSRRRRDLRLLDHLAPLGDLVGQHRDIGLRRAADGNESQLEKLAPYRRIAERLVEP